MSEGDVLVVFPSMLNKLGFCPRALFFELHSPMKPKPSARLRMLIGKMLHLLRGLFKRGYVREQLIKVEIEPGVLLVGRPDGFKVLDDHVVLEEFKSKKMPPLDKAVYGVRAWLGDLLQAMAYSYMLRKVYGKPVKAYLVYLDGRVEVPFIEDVFFSCLKTYRDIASGLFPEERRTKCGKCQYVEFCNALDQSGAVAYTNADIETAPASINNTA